MAAPNLHSIYSITDHPIYHPTADSAPVQLSVVSQKGVPLLRNRFSRKRCLILFHGGGMFAGWRLARFPPVAVKPFLERGWTILSADYTLLPEGGFRDVVRDVTALEEWVLRNEEEMRFDLGDLGVVGVSAGMTVATIALNTFTTLRPRAVLSLYGLLDIANPFYSQPAAPERYKGVFGEASGLTFDPIAHYLKPDSPKTWEDKTDLPDPSSRLALMFLMLSSGRAGKIYTNSWKEAFGGKKELWDVLTKNFPPTVIVHGTADRVVDIEGSRTFERKLKQLGVKCELEVVEGGDHGLWGAVRMEEDVKKIEEVFMGYMSGGRR